MAYDAGISHERQENSEILQRKNNFSFHIRPKLILEQIPEVLLSINEEIKHSVGCHLQREPTKTFEEKLAARGAGIFVRLHDTSNKIPTTYGRRSRKNLCASLGLKAFV
jgi:hypothetical protein